MVKKVKFADLPSLAGQEVGVSDWMLIDQDRINKFADATGDHQWIHVDVERAKKDMPGGKTIAHGFLTLSLLPVLMWDIMTVEGVRNGINYGSNKVRFTNQVPVGSRVRARQKILSVEKRPDGALQTTSQVTIEIEGQDRPACVAEQIGLSYPA